MALEAVVHRFKRERLAGDGRRAGVLAPAALGAGEDVETFLPRQVRDGARTDCDRGIVGHGLLEIDERHGVRRTAAPEEQRRQSGDDMEVLAERQDDEEREHDDHLRPVRRVVAGQQNRLRERREDRRDRVAREGEAALVRDASVRRGVQREPEAVEGEIGEHDRGDEREDQQRFAVALESRGLEGQPPVQRVAARRENRQLDTVLECSEAAAERPRQGCALVVADREELQLAQQQRHEADEDHRVHETRPPFAAHHAALQEAVDHDVRQARPRPIPAYVRLQSRDDRELSRGEPDECGKRRYQQQADADRVHRGMLPRPSLVAAARHAVDRRQRVRPPAAAWARRGRRACAAGRSRGSSPHDPAPGSGLPHGIARTAG